jgi:hypothetical protein
MICPTCRFCADRGLPHVCITRGELPGELTLNGLRLAYRDEWPALQQQLAEHPAAPLAWSAADLTAPTLRPVHRSWCACGCQAPAVA